VRRAQQGGFPCVATRTEAFRSALAVTDNNALGNVRLPIIPAQGIKGVLRRFGQKIVEESFGQRGLKMNAALYQSMRTGAVSGRPDGNLPPLDIAKSRRSHFYVGLFGGGTQIVPGWLYAKDARVLADCYLDIGAIPSGLGEQFSVINAYQLFEGRPTIRKDDLMQSADADAVSNVADYDDYMLAQIEEISKRRASKKSNEDDDSGSRSLQSISYKETVVGGTEFYFEVGAKHVNAAQAGMLIEAMGMFLANGQVGGCASVGYGRFMHNIMVQIDDNTYSGVFGDEAQPLLSTCPDEIVQLSQAMYEQLEEATPDSISAMMVTGG
jgi:CRISPR type IV-associated protein Csf2